MAFKYEILFQADILHTYFDGGLAKNLSFEPTPQCAALLDNYHLSFRNTDNGFILITELITNNGINWVQRLPVDIGTNLNFFIRSGRPDFLNITDSALANFSGGKKFFFGNNAATTTTLTPPKISFNVWSGAPLTTALSPGLTRFVATVDLPNNPFWLVLLGVNNNVLSKTLIQRNGANEILQNNVLLSANPLPEGIYTLQQTDSAGTVLSAQSFFLADSMIDASVAGIFQIQYNAAVDAAVTAGQEIHFTASLSARKIKWVYNIEVDQYTIPAEIVHNYDVTKLCLGDVTNTVPVLGTAFNPTIVPSPSPGAPAFVTFESGALINLRESPYEGIPLQDKTNPASLTTIISNLPNPSPLWLADAGGGNYKAEVPIKIK